jgi:hypothetical protein
MRQLHCHLVTYLEFQTQAEVGLLYALPTLKVARVYL